MHAKHLFGAAALSLALSGTAFAAGTQAGAGMEQDGAMAQDTMGMNAGTAGQPDLSNSLKVSSLKDLSVQDSQGQDIGNINEVLVDQDGNVSHVVVSQGGVLGVGGDSYLVPWDRINIDAQQQAAIIDVGQDQFSTEFSAFEELPPTMLDTDEGVTTDEGAAMDEGGAMDAGEPGSGME